MTQAWGRAAPDIRMPLPGPLAREQIALDRQVMSPSLARPYPLVARRARGAVIEDVDGNLFIDCMAGIAVCATGHCHPDVVRAIQEQSAELIHLCGADFYYPSQRELAETLASIVPGASRHRVLFTNSGAEAVEAAFKLARYHTGRPHVLSFYGAFHGRTMGALSLTGSKISQRRGFEPLIPQVTHVEYARCYRCPLHLTHPSCQLACVDEIERLFERTVAPDKVAALFVEPIQGEGGYVTPPTDFHPRLIELCRRHGILYIADEVQTGMGRTGKMLAVEHWNIEPDVVCLAKGLASGMPLGAMIAREDIMNWPEGAHASTFGGNPVSCAAALATIRLLQSGLIEHAAELGHDLFAQLRAMKARRRSIGDVRGKGLMMGVDLVKDRRTREPFPALRDALVRRCFEKGVLVLGCGASALRICPPLVISADEARAAFALIEEALTEVERDHHHQEDALIDVAVAI